MSNLKNKSEKMPMNKLLQIDARNQKEQRIEQIINDALALNTQMLVNI